MKFNALEKVFGITIIMLFVTVGSPYYVYSEAKINIVDELILDLRHGDPAVRQSAAHTLGYMKDPRVVGLLITALKDKDLGVRQSAISALTKTNELRERVWKNWTGA